MATTPAQHDAAADWVARFAALWAKPTPEGFHGMMHEDTQNQIPPMTAPADRAGVIAHFRQVLGMLPDLRLEVVDWAASGDAVMVCWRGSATLMGQLLAWEGIDRVVLRDGRTVAGRAYWDTQRLREDIAAIRARQG